MQRLVRALALVALGAPPATTVGALARKKSRYSRQKPQPSPAVSIRATGVGVPEIGEQGTIAISDLAVGAARYHDGGQYASDLSASTRRPSRSWYARPRRFARARSEVRVRKEQEEGSSGRRCAPPKLAIVSTSTRPRSPITRRSVSANNFSNAAGALATAAVLRQLPRHPLHPGPLPQAARRTGISVFAITGRPSVLGTQTRQNLTNVGYTDLQGVFFKPSGEARSRSRAGNGPPSSSRATG